MKLQLGRKMIEALPCPIGFAVKILVVITLLFFAPFPVGAEDDPPASEENAEETGEKDKPDEIEKLIRELEKQIQELKEKIRRLSEEQEREREEMQKQLRELREELRAEQEARDQDELEKILAEAEAETAEEAEKDKEAEKQRDEFTGRQRNLQALNPEISFLGDFSYDWSDTEVRDQFLVRGIEIGNGLVTANLTSSGLMSCLPFHLPLRR